MFAMRILCVMLPHFQWRCEALRRPDIAGKPAIIVQSKGVGSSQKIVIDHSPGLDDLAYGLPVQQALARHDDVIILQSDIPHYRAIFTRILNALEQVSPLVEGADTGCVYIGADGLQLIFPDDSALAGAVRSVVADFAPQIGLAANKFLASLAAQRGTATDFKALDGDVAPFLKDLSCDVLPVSLKSKGKLHEFGVHTLGQVSAMSPGPLQAQFGPEGRHIWQLSRGIDDTPLKPRFMEEVIEESVTLSSVTVSMDAIVTTAESILVAVLPAIVSRGLGVRSLALWTRTWNAESWEKSITFKEPAMDVKSIIFRLKRLLEEYPQPGPVEQLGIKVERLGFPRGRQKSLFSDIRAKEHLAEDIKQLELKLGNPQVYQVKEIEPWSRIPERRYALTPANR